MSSFEFVLIYQFTIFIDIDAYIPTTVRIAPNRGYKVLGQKFPYTQVQLPMMPSLNLLDPHNHNLESLSSWHTS